MRVWNGLENIESTRKGRLRRPSCYPLVMARTRTTRSWRRRGERHEYAHTHIPSHHLAVAIHHPFVRAAHPYAFTHAEKTHRTWDDLDLPSSPAPSLIAIAYDMACCCIIPTRASCIVHRYIRARLLSSPRVRPVRRRLLSFLFITIARFFLPFFPFSTTCAILFLIPCITLRMCVCAYFCYHLCSTTDPDFYPVTCFDDSLLFGRWPWVVGRRVLLP